MYVKKGDTAPYVIKTADKSSANVGDKITYTVKVGNSDGAVYEIENAKMADTIPAEFDFVDGSVQVDGKSYPYSYDNASRKLSVFIGNLKPNAARTVTFAVTVNKLAYSKTRTTLLSSLAITSRTPRARTRVLRLVTARPSRKLPRLRTSPLPMLAIR